MPELDSLDQLNAMVDAWDTADDARRIGTRAHTVGELFAVERPLLVALPEEVFETGTWLGPRVDRYSQVTVRVNRYSVPVPVPVRLVGRQVRVHLHASHLVIYDGRIEVGEDGSCAAGEVAAAGECGQVGAGLLEHGRPGGCGVQRAGVGVCCGQDQPSYRGQVRGCDVPGGRGRPVGGAVAAVVGDSGQTSPCSYQSCLAPANNRVARTSSRPASARCCSRWRLSAWKRTCAMVMAVFAAERVDLGFVAGLGEGPQPPRHRRGVR
ncbi:hypothetical protein ACFO1B_55945 [Dactylosporangium siamense]|uniref:Mu transposase domain-containing protein n=1 Tax=Dactylosporangium siamense TaxID=685454 RepID=UPI002FE90823